MKAYDIWGHRQPTGVQQVKCFYPFWLFINRHLRSVTLTALSLFKGVRKWVKPGGSNFCLKNVPEYLTAKAHYSWRVMNCYNPDN